MRDGDGVGFADTRRGRRAGGRSPVLSSLPPLQRSIVCGVLGSLAAAFVASAPFATMGLAPRCPNPGTGIGAGTQIGYFALYFGALGLCLGLASGSWGRSTRLAVAGALAGAVGALALGTLGPSCWARPPGLMGELGIINIIWPARGGLSWTVAFTAFGAVLAIAAGRPGSLATYAAAGLVGCLAGTGIVFYSYSSLGLALVFSLPAGLIGLALGRDGGPAWEEMGEDEVVVRRCPRPPAGRDGDDAPVDDARKDPSD